MELIDKVKEALEKELGIKTEAELMEAVKEFPGVDLGVFVTPLKAGVKNVS